MEISNNHMDGFGMVCGLVVSGTGEGIGTAYNRGWVYGGDRFTFKIPSELVCISVVVPLYSQAEISFKRKFHCSERKHLTIPETYYIIK
ncbi:MAG: hypothetical protein MSH60_07935 [Ruminococcus sp.]|nr:hypothetical protein [Ruminococcus sp.]